MFLYFAIIFRGKIHNFLNYLLQLECSFSVYSKFNPSGVSFQKSDRNDPRKSRKHWDKLIQEQFLSTKKGCSKISDLIKTELNIIDTVRLNLRNKEESWTVKPLNKKKVSNEAENSGTIKTRSLREICNSKIRKKHGKGKLAGEDFYNA